MTIENKLFIVGILASIVSISLTIYSVIAYRKPPQKPEQK